MKNNNNQEIIVSSTIQCCFCRKRKKNKKKQPAQCLDCSTQPGLVIICCSCFKRKPLNEFSKNQRRKESKPSCRNCIKIRSEEDIWATDDSDDY